MGAEKPQRSYGLMLRQFLLVVAMIGLEACGSLEIILMIANIQTLGVPIRFSSLPGTVSAALGMFLIPGIGLFMDKKATSKSAKAKILLCTSSFELLGALLIFAANMTKLLFYDSVDVNNHSGSHAWIHAVQETANSSSFPPYSTTYSPSTNSIWYNTTLVSTTFHSLTSDANTRSTEANEAAISTQDENIRYYAILAMIGFSLIDIGYDSSNCFFKTFALESTAPKDQTSVIVKSIFVSSFGGCLMAVLASVGLGGVLTANTSHDSYAAQGALLAGIGCVLLVIGITTTLITGFFCPPSNYTILEEEAEEHEISPKPADEKSRLIVAGEVSRDSTSSLPSASPTHEEFKKSAETSFADLNDDSSPKFQGNGEIDHLELSPRTGFVGFVIRQKKQILINVSTFFMLGALYSFEVFSLNFVGSGIFHGDPFAAVTSEDYKKYVRGLQSGSLGLLLLYIAFTVATSVHEILLDKVGWKLEIFVSSTVLIVLSITCAFVESMWAFYITVVWLGLFRAFSFSIPYVLANQFALEQSKGKNSGVAMAAVAAMLPFAFTVCSAVMGPLISATGNPATPLYYTAVSAFLGMIPLVFLKSD